MFVLIKEVLFYLDNRHSYFDKLVVELNRNKIVSVSLCGVIK